MLPPSISQVNECICALTKSLTVLNCNLTWCWEKIKMGRQEQNTDMYIHLFLKFSFDQSNIIEKGCFNDEHFPAVKKRAKWQVKKQRLSSADSEERHSQVKKLWCFFTGGCV